MTSNKITQKNKLQAKKLGQLEEKTAKNHYLYVPFCWKNTFQIRKGIHLTQCMIKKLSSLRKNYFTQQFYSLSLLGQNAISTNSTPGRKNLKKTNTT